MLRISTLITLMMLLLSDTAFAEKLSCDDMDKLVTTGKIVYEQDDLPYYSNDKTLSRLVIYQVPDRSIPGLESYYFTSILYVGTKRYYLYLNFFGTEGGGMLSRKSFLFILPILTKMD